MISNLVKTLDKIEWTGRVVKVSDNGNVIINAGTETGLQIGDTLIISSLGEMLTDPETGVAIGREPGNPKGKVKIMSLMGTNAAICNVVDGSGFARDDQVKLAD